MRNVDWERVYKKQMKPPILPNPRVSYFDKEAGDSRISNFSFVNDARQFRTYSQVVPQTCSNYIENGTTPDISYYTKLVQADGSKTCKIDMIDENFASAIGRTSKQEIAEPIKDAIEEIKLDKANMDSFKVSFNGFSFHQKNEELRLKQSTKNNDSTLKKTQQEQEKVVHLEEQSKKKVEQKKDSLLKK